MIKSFFWFAFHWIREAILDKKSYAVCLCLRHSVYLKPDQWWVASSVQTHSSYIWRSFCKISSTESVIDFYWFWTSFHQSIYSIIFYFHIWFVLFFLAGKTRSCILAVFSLRHFLSLGKALVISEIVAHRIEIAKHGKLGVIFHNWHYVCVSGLSRFYRVSIYHVGGNFKAKCLIKFKHRRARNSFYFFSELLVVKKVNKYNYKKKNNCVFLGLTYDKRFLLLL